MGRAKSKSALPGESVIISIAFLCVFILIILNHSYPNIRQPQIKLFFHQELKVRSTTRPLLEEASMTLPPPATIPTWPLTTMISPAFKLPKLVIFVYFPTFLQPEEVK